MPEDATASEAERALAEARRATTIAGMRWNQRRLVHGADSQEAEQAARRLQASLLLYWEQLKRFRGDKRVTEHWHERVCEAGSLADLGRYRYETETRTITEFDTDANRERPRRAERPKTLAPRDAFALFDQLDEIANTLGFDMEADRAGKETGVGTADDPEDMDHVNANPLEVAADGGS